ncbi:hypothetical protein M408DRAFT_23593 [Serendipita vermifera MAFF 305830]|uniref:Cytochrome P450 n=1 Tax=Serendipita vermifera MAFF 305830 TaxID=933852 RepID=A0A0C3BAR7_SERVB|nr:hypothetical protein M408DRAFT_23593 [Serendipita vermifera MAFF 305830]
MSPLIAKVQSLVTSPFGLATLAIGIPILWLTYRAIVFLTAPLFSPMKVIDGPPNRNLVMGHFGDLVNGNGYTSLSTYKEQYGHVFLIRALFGELTCVTTDNRAVAHLLSNHMTYYKPEFVRFQLSYLLGQGLVSVEGMEHRYQRRIMMPSFSSSHLRNILPTFVAKSAELRDVLNEQIAASAIPPTVDMAEWLSRTTLDIIGLAGFNYDFSTLRQGKEGSELSASFHRFNSETQSPIVMLLKGFIPPLRIFEFDAAAREARTLRKIMRDIGLQLIEDKQKEVISEKASGGGTVLEKKGHDRDLLSLMIKSNMSTTTPPDQRLSVSQILNQIPTFLLAGHETTSNSTAWCLYALAQRPEMQSRLRAELLDAFPDDNVEVTIESLSALPYLEAVVRETMRYHAPVELSSRVAEGDDLIPLDREFIGRDGKARKHIQVKKGDTFMIPIILMNRSKEVWGPDADEFNPDRWLVDRPAAVSDIPGLWANLMTFLGGQRACIGFKFAILEMKSLLLHLFRAFEFELAVDAKDIVCKELIVTRPFVRFEIEKGPQLPMIIRPVNRA